MPLFINGKFVQSKTDKWIDLRNPATNEVIFKVPQATKEEVGAAEYFPFALTVFVDGGV